MSSQNKPFLNIKKENYPKLSQICNYVIYSKRLKNEFETRSGNILSFLLPLFQEGQLSVTGESMCTKY